MFERFTESARRATVLSHSEAQFFGHSHIGTEHVLSGLVFEDYGVAAEVLRSFGLSLKAVRQQIEKLKGPEKYVGPESLPFSPRAKAALQAALTESLKLGHNYIGPEHLLLGLLRQEQCTACQILIRLEAPLDEVRQRTIEVLSRHAESSDRAVMKERRTLDRFSVNLTQVESEDRLGPVIGRDKEISRVIQILSRQNRNIPLIIGERGVGKDSIVVGLMQTITAGNVPPHLGGRTVHSLDFATLLTDPQFRGRSAELISKILEDIRNDEALIISLNGFLAPLHLPDETTNAFKLLQSLMTKPEVLIVGVSDWSEYNGRDPDPAFDRLTQLVPIEEQPAEEIRAILKSVRGRLEQHHEVCITDAAVEAAVTLARDHVPEQLLPGSAIDLLDEASAFARVREARSKEPQSPNTQKTKMLQRKSNVVEQNASVSDVALRFREEELLATRNDVAEPDADLLKVTEAEVVEALAVYSGTLAAPPQRTPVTHRLLPTDHDPYVWSMS
ncbi:Clp protease N-terminal domain-containing protein [Streptomyces triticisoli]|uniref:Clp protease N-terminal domain-containing protein n=1 Tax=Streptomyces triticisoli TaxID=2182797 RepID=UPI000DD6C8ED|nr:Clp protease N-terminal domain-containing protein [Streptomyces triticisoli]